MPSQEDIRAIARQLPHTLEGAGRFGIGVLVKGKSKGFVWSWMERVDPKKPKVESDVVVAISVPDLVVREMLIQSNPKALFTEPHYQNYPAILVRLEEIELTELEDLLIEGWRCKATPAMVKEYDSGRS